MNALELIARSGTVGAGGAGFPTHAKLTAQVEVLIANGAECEPLLHSNQELLLREAPAVIEGLRAVAQIIGARRTVIAIKEKYHEVIHAVETALRAAEAAPTALPPTGAAAQTGLPPAGNSPTVELFPLRDFYPAGDEHAIVLEVTGRVVPEAGLPLDVGVVVQNVETLWNVGAALKGQPVTHKWVTVTGAVKTPVTLRVPVGAPISALVAAAGGATVPEWSVVDGGPMMGKPVTDPSRPVTKTTGGIIVLPTEHRLIQRPLLDFAIEARRARTSCVRCRMCTDLCPRYLEGHGLHPHQIMQSLALFPLTDAIYDQAALCCECGICEVFSCPMGLSPRRVLGHLKREFGAQGRRYQKQPKTYQVRDGAEFRKVTAKRLVYRLGVDSYDRPAPFRDAPLRVAAVTLLLRQHIGAPAVPVVNEGDRVQAGQLVADVPQGKLGAPVHASIGGVVTRVTGESIRIEEAAGHA